MEKSDETGTPAQATKTENTPKSAFVGPSGERLNSKPERLTHLYGNRLVEKDNPVIALRGKLDTLCAMILEAQALGAQADNREFVSDLQEVLDFALSLLSAEYTRAPLGEFCLLGLTSDDLRKRSHQPEKYFGLRRLPMTHAMGALCLRLNLLRAAVRETELAAVAVLRDSEDASKACHEDIAKALNRLSSLFHILTFKYLPESFRQARQETA